MKKVTKKPVAKKPVAKKPIMKSGGTKKPLKKAQLGVSLRQGPLTENDTKWHDQGYMMDLPIPYSRIRDPRFTKNTPANQAQAMQNMAKWHKEEEEDLRTGWGADIWESFPVLYKNKKGGTKKTNGLGKSKPVSKIRTAKKGGSTKKRK